LARTNSAPQRQSPQFRESNPHTEDYISAIAAIAANILSIGRRLFETTRLLFATTSRRHSMKRLFATAALLLAVGTALPALAATPHNALPAEHRQVQQHRMNTSGYINGYDAYAAQTGAPFVNAPRNTRGCVERTDSGSYSAFPSWEVCN
jgi:hypothetical protein